MPPYLITLTVTPFADFSLLLFAVQIPPCASFAVGFGPKKMFRKLAAMNPPQQAVGLLLIKPSHETACMQFCVNDIDLGHLHFHPPSLEPQLICHLDACERLGIRMQMRSSDPYAADGQG